MPAECKHNNYVPRGGTKKRFIPTYEGDQKLFYLNLRPESVIEPCGAHIRGVTLAGWALRRALWRPTLIRQ